MTSADEPKTVVRRYVDEFVTQRNVDIAGEIFADDFVNHSAGPNDPKGRDGLIQFFTMIQTGFPDFDVVVEDLFAEGDRVAIRFTFHGTHHGEFMGIPPTGQRVTMPGIDILRIEGGKIAELWGQEDMLGMLQQLGVLPGSAAPTG